MVGFTRSGRTTAPPNVWTALTGTNTSVTGISANGTELYMSADNYEWVYDGTPGLWTALCSLIR
jgi:hypothetical protein